MNYIKYWVFAVVLDQFLLLFSNISLLGFPKVVEKNLNHVTTYKFIWASKLKIHCQGHDMDFCLSMLSIWVPSPSAILLTSNLVHHVLQNTKIMSIDPHPSNLTVVKEITETQVIFVALH